MKKPLLLFTALAASFVLQAQWVDDPQNNNHLANTSSFAGEIYTATDPVSGDTYIQWMEGHANGWSPSLQRLSYDGTPQWGPEGIHISGHSFSSSSEGVAMVATADQAVVSCFATNADVSIAVKINADGSFAWGEQGIVLFDGQGFSRTELTAGTDGGVWALGFDYSSLYLQYVEADGTLNPTITVSDNMGYSISYGQLTLGKDGIVFLTYERIGSGFYTEKEIYVAGFRKDGSQYSSAVCLMASQVFQVTYIHRAVSDGADGGYAYLWHPGIGEVFNTYVFHFDQNGLSTISDINGVAAHSSDPLNYYLDANATVDPVSHDLLIAYQQTDVVFQSECKLFVNRITTTGERLWGDGLLVLDNGTIPCSNLLINAFEDGSGFSVIYNKATDASGYNTTIEAQGFDMDGNHLWTTTICNNAYNKTMCDNSTGFHDRQNIVAWVDANNGGLVGQNISTNGSMGYIEPELPCLAPTNFDGYYHYDEETGTFGTMLTWDAPETQPLWYNIFITLPDQTIITAEIDPTETEFFHEMTVGATITYQLTATYEYCVSDFALTSDGSNYVTVDITGIPENTDERIVTVTKIYTLNGQLLHNADTETLSNGVYIIQGLNGNGIPITKKMVVNH